MPATRILEHRRSNIASEPVSTPTSPAALAQSSGGSFRIKSNGGPQLPRRLLRLLISARVFFNHCLRRCQPRDRHPERRSADIIHSQAMAELHAFRVPAMLSANPHLQLWPRLSSSLRSPAHQHPHSFSVERLKWVCAKHSSFFLIYVVGQESPGVIAREAHGGLRQVVSAE